MNVQIEVHFSVRGKNGEESRRATSGVISEEVFKKSGTMLRKGDSLKFHHMDPDVLRITLVEPYPKLSHIDVRAVPSKRWAEVGSGDISPTLNPKFERSFFQYLEKNGFKVSAG